MKTLFYLFIFLPLINSAQIVNVNKEDWAGGICCSSGTNYSISIIIDPRVNDCFESVTLKVDNILIDLDEKQFSIQQFNDSLKVYSYAFGIRNSMTYRYEGYNTSYFGMSEKNFYESDQYENKITIIYARKRAVEKDYKFTETYTAYP